MSDKPADPTPPPDDGERIAKVLAHAGVASRREAERLIEAGRISVNGKTLTTPAVKVGPGDDVRFDGQPIAARPPTKLWRHHKPVGRVTTHSDPEGRETVFDALPASMGRVISVGRLDLNSEGLLLLTNDGELARVLELPATAWTRRYRVRAFGDITDAEIEKLKAGITVEGVRYGPVEVVVDRRTGSNIWLTVGLKEGKNREIRKVLSAVGLSVNRLLRTAYGPLQLGALGKDETEEVKLSVLRDQLGKLYPLDSDGYPVKAGQAPSASDKPNTGRAKAKPRPKRPGGEGGGHGGHGGPGKPGRPKEKPGAKTSGRPDANRRRKP